MKTLFAAAAAGLLAFDSAAPPPLSAQSLPAQTQSAPAEPFYDDFGADPFGAGPADPFSFDPVPLDPADGPWFNDRRPEDGAAGRPRRERREGGGAEPAPADRGCWGVPGQRGVRRERSRPDILDPQFEATRDGRRPALPISGRRTRPADDFGGRPGDAARRSRDLPQREPRTDPTPRPDLAADFDPSFDPAEPWLRDETALPSRRIR
ncbi:hypothetical protein [Alienimonas sp. DA493]|uniref:hypothetical protein n=1 Tax=Alienimonas sp. DA493 TaxID=3373605 RepID=UPI0037553B6D